MTHGLVGPQAGKTFEMERIFETCQLTWPWKWRSGRTITKQQFQISETNNSYFRIQIWLLTVTTELTSERGLEERELWACVDSHFGSDPGAKRQIYSRRHMIPAHPRLILVESFGAGTSHCFLIQNWPKDEWTQYMTLNSTSLNTVLFYISPAYCIMKTPWFHLAWSPSSPPPRGALSWRDMIFC